MRAETRAEAQEHSKECEAFQREQAATIEKYKADWPEHCKNCDGWGFFYYPSTRWQPEEYAPCHKCIEEGKCPRCGKDAWQELPDDSATCPHCGFTEIESEGLPEESHCMCGTEGMFTD